MTGAHRILIAHRDAVLTGQMHRFLEAEGYAVCVADERADALALARQIRPSVLLSDRAQPDATGTTLSQQCKSDALLRSCHCLLLTSGSPRARIAGLHGGANDCLTQPFSELELLARIQAGIRAVDHIRSLETHSQEQEMMRVALRRHEAQSEALTRQLIEMAAQLQSEICRNAELEAERVRLAKLETLVQSAVTLNHEINNPLFIITGSVESALARLESSSLEAEDLATLQTRLNRVLLGADRITSVVRAFAASVTPATQEYVSGITMLQLPRAA